MYFPKVRFYGVKEKAGSNVYNSYPTDMSREFVGAIKWYSQKKKSYDEVNDSVILEDVDNMFTDARIVDYTFRETSGVVYKAVVNVNGSDFLVDLRPKQLFDLLNSPLGVTNGRINSPVCFLNKSGQIELSLYDTSKVEAFEKVQNALEENKSITNTIRRKDLVPFTLYQKAPRKKSDIDTYYYYFGDVFNTKTNKVVPLIYDVSLQSQESMDKFLKAPMPFLWRYSNSLTKNITPTFYKVVGNQPIKPIHLDETAIQNLDVGLHEYDGSIFDIRTHLNEVLDKPQYYKNQTFSKVVDAVLENTGLNDEFWVNNKDTFSFPTKEECTFEAIKEKIEDFNMRTNQGITIVKEHIPLVKSIANVLTEEELAVLTKVKNNIEFFTKENLKVFMEVSGSVSALTYDYKHYTQSFLYKMTIIYTLLNTIVSE